MDERLVPAGYVRSAGKESLAGCAPQSKRADRQCRSGRARSAEKGDSWRLIHVQRQLLPRLSAECPDEDFARYRAAEYGIPLCEGQKTVSSASRAVRISLATDAQAIERCFPIMSQLRPHLEPGRFVDTVQRQQGGG